MKKVKSTKNAKWVVTLPDAWEDKAVIAAEFDNEREAIDFKEEQIDGVLQEYQYMVKVMRIA